MRAHGVAAGFLLALFLLLSTGCSTMVRIVAHRGASHDAPENTLASVELAWKQGADAVEVDVYLSRDGRIVVIHDKDTKRTAGIEGLVAERSFSELRSLDVGAWKGAEWAGERIPALEEVLERLPPGKLLYVEVKCGPEIIPELARVFAASGKRPEQIRVISFNRDLVEGVKRALPDYDVYALSGWERDKETGAWSPGVEELVSRALEIGADGLGVAHDGPLEELASRLQAAGLELHVWTVNDVDVARRMVDIGVLSITTDRPGWLRERLSENAE